MMEKTRDDREHEYREREQRMEDGKKEHCECIE
jgi:hypothetical protein